MNKYLHGAAIVVILLGGTLSFMAAKNDAVTFDEIAHVGAGYSYLTQHDYRLNPEHPPLLKVLAAGPLLVLDPPFAITQEPWWTSSNHVGEYGQWEAGRVLLHGDANADDSLTFASRVPLILLAILFSIFLFFWGRKLGGPKAGMATGFIALVLWTFDPNILGHNHLVTTDIGAAAALCVALYYFIQFVELPSWKNTLLAGLFFGLANAVKFSAIILIPFLMLMLLLHLVLHRGQKTQSPIRLYLLRGGVVAVTTLVTIFLIYIPVSYNTPTEVLDSITPAKIHNTEKQIDVWTKESILAVNHIPELRPLALYLHGVAQVFHRVAGGNQTYFIGTVSTIADPLYFPIVFLLKESLLYLFLYTLICSLSFLMLVRGLGTLRDTGVRDSYNILRSFLRAHFTELTLVLFIIFYALLAILGNLTIGIRHLFPILPPLYLLTARILTRAYTRLQDTRVKKILVVLAVAYGGALMILALRTFPMYLSFFNGIAGGPQNGWHYVVDSNTDWGQDSIRLKEFTERENISKIRVDYFGGDLIQRRLGDTMIPWWDTKRPVEPGYYALSATLLQDSVFGNKPFDESYRWTQSLTPYAVIGGMIIYKVEE